MVDDANTGVTNPPEGDTGTSTPGSEQTTQTTEAPATEAKPEVSEDDRPVPYSRFKEVNEKSKQYEAKLQEVEARLSEMDKRVAPPQVDAQEQQVKTLLNQYGYLSRDEFQTELDKREQRLREDTQVSQELSRLETKYDGKNGLPKFDRQKVVNFALDRRLADPEVAYKTLYEKEYLNWHIQQATNKSKGVKTESSDGSGGQSVGPANQDLMSEAMKGDDKAFNTLIKRTNAFTSFFKK
jgi:hypothetical protein